MNNTTVAHWHQETYDGAALVKSLEALRKSNPTAILSYNEWHTIHVARSKRPSNYTNQINKLQKLSNAFHTDIIGLMAHWYYTENLSLHHISNILLGEHDYQYKALHVFVTKKLYWQLRPHNQITADGKEVLGVIAHTRSRE